MAQPVAHSKGLQISRRKEPGQPPARLSVTAQWMACQHMIVASNPSKQRFTRRLDQFRLNCHQAAQCSGPSRSTRPPRLIRSGHLPCSRKSITDDSTTRCRIKVQTCSDVQHQGMSITTHGPPAPIIGLLHAPWHFRALVMMPSRLQSH